MIIDFHIHVGDRGFWHPWVFEWMLGFREKSGIERVMDQEGKMNPRALVSLLEEAGVNYGVVLAELSPVTTGMITNEYVAEFCAREPRLIPFCNINPHLVANPSRELVRCVEELGCRGLKLLPTYQGFYPNDPSIYPLYARAEELRIPVLIHTGSSIFKGSRLKYGNPLSLDDVAVDFPDLPIVLAHSGRGVWYEEAFLLSQLHGNVYMEVSGLPPQNLLNYFPRLGKNADRVLFGSDWPGMPGIAENIAAIRALPLKEEVKDKILGENARKILDKAISEKAVSRLTC